MATAPSKILIVGPSWVGDMVMAQSLFIELVRLQSDVEIDVLAPPWSLPILERMPQVRRGLSMPLGHGQLQLGRRYRLGRELAAQNYDRAIVLPNSFKSALVPLFAGIPRRSGWRGEMRFGLLNDIRLLNKDQYPLMVQRFVALAAESEAACPSLQQCPQPVLQINSDAAAKQLERFQLQRESSILALCAGAEFGPSKRWPEQRYAELASTYIARGWQVVLFGSDNDREVTSAIRGALAGSDQERCIDLAGQTSLAEAVDILSQVTAVVSNDSGLMHIAAALNLPLVVVYGSTSPAFTPPLSHRVKVLEPAVSCAPCFQRECPLNGEQTMQCMKHTEVETCVENLDQLLS